jgi:hypothetical protein
MSVKVLANFSASINKQEIVDLFKQGMNNAIYNYPSKQFKLSYVRTGNLKKAVRFKRDLPGLSGTTLSFSVYVDGGILARLPNPQSKNRDYSKYTGFAPNNTVMSLGWYPFSKELMLNFILTDIISRGII